MNNFTIMKKIITNSIISFILIVSIKANAQWVQCGIYGGNAHSFATFSNNIFAGSSGYGVFLSTNTGTSWTQTALNNVSINSVTSLGLSSGIYFYKMVAGDFVSIKKLVVLK
jgi:hypothetical protein